MNLAFSKNLKPLKRPCNQSKREIATSLVPLKKLNLSIGNDRANFVCFKGSQPLFPHLCLGGTVMWDTERQLPREMVVVDLH